MFWPLADNRLRGHRDLRGPRHQDDRGSVVRSPLKRVKASVHAFIICVNGSVAAVGPFAHVSGVSSARAASNWPSPAALRRRRSGLVGRCAPALRRTGQ